MIWIISLFTLSAFASIDREQLLLRQASLEAEKIHVRNVSLLGIDPATCKASKSSALMLGQIKKVKEGKLNHCPEYVKEKLRALDEEIQNVKNGVLVYAPLKLPDLSDVPSGPSTEQISVGPVTEDIVSELPVSPVAESSQIDHMGLTDEQRKRILIYYEKSKGKYVSYDDDSLFLMLSNAYMRNLPRLMAGPRPDEENR